MGDYFVLENLSLIVHLIVIVTALRVLPALRRAHEHAAAASIIGIVSVSALGAVLYGFGIIRRVLEVIETPVEGLLPLFHLAVACALFLAVKALSNFQNRREPYAHDGKRDPA